MPETPHSAEPDDRIRHNWPFGSASGYHASSTAEGYPAHPPPATHGPQQERWHIPAAHAQHAYGSPGTARSNDGYSANNPPVREEWTEGYRGAYHEAPNQLARSQEYGVQDPYDRDMPNFEATLSHQNSNHRRGYSIEGHLQANPTLADYPSSGASVDRIQGASAAGASIPGQREGFGKLAQKMRSQPNLRNQMNSNAVPVFEMPGDVPAVPPMQQRNFQTRAPQSSQLHPIAQPFNLQTHENVPPPLHPSHMPNMQNPAHFAPPRPLHQPPYRNDHRDLTGSSQWSDPGPDSTQSTHQGAGYGPERGVQPREGSGSAQGLNQGATESSRQTANPDALPHHPLPVRPGLHGSSAVPQPAKPPPVRQYHTERSIVQANASPSANRRASQITYAEIDRLRGIVKANPADSKTQLILAKALVEAASVLANDNGRADHKTTLKNREKYILEAHKIVKKLANHGNAEALYYLADCYGQGKLGLAVDTKEAFTLYQSAAKAGHAGAAYRTAVCCEIGTEDGGGTRKDPLKAVQWYRRAAALGDTPAMYKMGIVLLNGLLGQGKNLGEALTWLKRAADRADEDNPHALHELGLIYSAPAGNERIIKDDAYALQLFTQSAELGYKFSQFRLGEIYEHGLFGCPVDPHSSIAWYSRAAAQGEHQSELALSGWYLTGSSGILEQSDTEAYLWARKAACARPPLPKAMYAMGYFTEIGIGCPRSFDEAKRWYERAACESPQSEFSRRLVLLTLRVLAFTD